MSGEIDAEYEARFVDFQILFLCGNYSFLSLESGLMPLIIKSFFGSQNNQTFLSVRLKGIRVCMRDIKVLYKNKSKASKYFFLVVKINDEGMRQVFL